MNLVVYSSREEDKMNELLQLIVNGPHNIFSRLFQEDDEYLDNLKDRLESFFDHNFEQNDVEYCNNSMRIARYTYKGRLQLGNLVRDIIRHKKVDRNARQKLIDEFNALYKRVISDIQRIKMRKRGNSKVVKLPMNTEVEHLEQENGDIQTVKDQIDSEVEQFKQNNDNDSIVNVSKGNDVKVEKGENENNDHSNETIKDTNEEPVAVNLQEENTQVINTKENLEEETPTIKEDNEQSTKENISQSTKEDISQSTKEDGNGQVEDSSDKEDKKDVTHEIVEDKQIMDKKETDNSKGDVKAIKDESTKQIPFEDSRKVDRSVEDGSKNSYKKNLSREKSEGDSMKYNALTKDLQNTENVYEKGKMILCSVVLFSWYPNKDKVQKMEKRMKSSLRVNVEEESDKPVSSKRSVKKKVTVSDDDYRRYRPDDLSDISNDDLVESDGKSKNKDKMKWLVPAISFIGGIILVLLLKRGGSAPVSVPKDNSNVQPSQVNTANVSVPENNFTPPPESKRPDDISDFSKDLFNKVKKQREVDEFGNPILTAAEMAKHAQ